MGDGLWLGWDLGGGGGRCLVLDGRAGVLASAARSWRPRPAPGSGGIGLDLDGPGMWAAMGEATAQALARADRTPSDVDGIAVAAVRFASLLLDGRGELIFAAANTDARAAVEGFQIAAEHGERVHAISGLWPMPIYPIARLRWLAAHEPERLAGAAHLLALSDWLGLRLTGAVATDPSQAGCTGLLDLDRGRWSQELCERLDVPLSLLPEIRPSASRLGGLTAEAAAGLGLRAGTPVAVGGGDSQCGLVGAGATRPGACAAVVGTTAPVQAVFDEPVRDPEGALWSGRHVVADQYVLESNAGPMGDSLAWMARLLHPDSPDPVGHLLSEARDASPGAAGLLSSVGADGTSARSPGIPVGHVALAPLASPDDERPGRQVARATVDGLACGLRLQLERLRAVRAFEPEPFALGGGVSRSDTFARCVAGVLQRPVALSRTPDATALGAALCAAVGSGAFADLPAAADALAPARAVVEPESAEAYASLWQAWSGWREARAPADAQAAGRAGPFVVAARAPGAADAADAPRLDMLVTAAMDDEALAALAELGDVEYASFREKMRMLTGDPLVEALGDRPVFITEIDVVDADAIARLPALRVVASCRGDAVNVDIGACTAHGIPVLNAPGRNADAVADLTVAFALMLARKLAPATAFLREEEMEAGDMAKMGRAFSAFQGRELWRRTVGLVGLGAVGRKVAARLRPFGVRLLVADPYVDAERAAEAGGRLASLAELLAESDFVSLHAAVTDETRGLIDAEAFARMKPGAMLINTARAALLDEPALVDALESGHLGGAALDTFAVEPPGHDHPLLARADVIATPHIGGNTVEVAAHQGAIIAADLAALVRGGRPRHVRNPEVLADFSFLGPRRVPDAEELAALGAAPGPAVTDLDRDRRARPAARAAGSAGGGKAPTAETAGGASGDRLLPVLERFVAALRADQAVARAAAGRDVTLAFALTDVDLAFHLRLSEPVEAALGPPPETPDVQLRMTGTVLDGMLSGSRNAMQAAMEGEISFTGDAARAMAIQELQADFERLYRDARDGGPEAGAAEPGSG